MTDAELCAWWPELGHVVIELWRIGQPAVADRLVDAVRGGATSSEILGDIGLVLREQCALRSLMSKAATLAWDAVMADVRRAFPGLWFGYWLARFVRR